NSMEHVYTRRSVHHTDDGKSNVVTLDEEAESKAIKPISRKHINLVNDNQTVGIISSRGYRADERRLSGLVAPTRLQSLATLDALDNFWPFQLENRYLHLFNIL